MGDKTGIEWTDATWNPVVGCAPVSEGCRNCYAAREAVRFGANPKVAATYEGLAEMRGADASRRAVFTGKIRTLDHRLDQPLRWKRPRRIFVNSMSDLFHPDVPVAFINEVFRVMSLAPQHTFQLLTKRPERMAEYLRGDYPMPNVWLGTSVEDQAAADERIPHLLNTPAAVRFLSCEPLLGHVDLRPHLHGLDWVIVGGESGPRARPMHPFWVRGIRNQCQDRGVPFLFKQWGAWQNGSVPTNADDRNRIVFRDGSVMTDVEAASIKPGGPARHDGHYMARVGKKKAGRELDGRTWDEMPEVVTS